MGTGHAAAKFCTGLKAVDSMRAAAVTSRTVEKANAFARQFDCDRTYGSDLTMLPDVDAVYIATPATHHAGPVMRALDFGKPVLCEKPLCINLKNVERIVAAAQTENTLLIEGQWNRFTPLMTRVLKEVRSGRIGEVTEISASFGKCISPTIGHRLYKRELGGGALMDLGGSWKPLQNR